MAVVDAGSTGSRVHIYAYDMDEKQAAVHIEHIWSNKTKPGLAQVELENMDAYLTHLLENAPVNNIPVYFYATAGMRLMSQPKQQLAYQRLQQWFNTQSQWMLQEAKTITGQQEGVYGWLAVNYKLGTIHSDSKSLVSVMDMGGASVQIAIPVEHADGIKTADLVQLTGVDRPITLFVHSFLGLGQTETSHHYLNAPHCFPYDYPLPNHTTGQGDAHLCQADISRLINSVHDVNALIKPVLAANPNHAWYALSGLPTLVKNKPFNFIDNQFKSNELLQQADTHLCHQSWYTLNQQYADNDYAFVNCLTSSYYYALLVDGYGLQPEESIHFMPDEDEPDWTLGVVLQAGLNHHTFIS